MDIFFHNTYSCNIRNLFSGSPPGFMDLEVYAFVRLVAKMFLSLENIHLFSFYMAKAKFLSGLLAQEFGTDIPLYISLYKCIAMYFTNKFHA